MLKKIIAILGALAILVGFATITLRFVYNNAARDMTRAEFVSYINTDCGFTAKSETQYADVTDDKWYADDFLIAQSAGYIPEQPGGTVTPDTVVSKSDAHIMIENVISLLNITGLSDDAIERLDTLKGSSEGMSVSELKAVMDAVLPGR